MNTMPGAIALSLRAFNSMLPRRVVTRIGSPAAMPSRRSSAGAKLAAASGSSSSSTVARRDIAGAPGFGREAVAEHDIAPGHRLGIAGIGDGMLAQQPLPGDAVEGRHRRFHLREDVARMAVGP